MSKLAVFFPGIGYHNDKPLLYYSRKLAKQQGYDEALVNYTYEKAGIMGNAEKLREAAENLYLQAKSTLENIAFEDYDKVLFVSKSIGTAIASKYAFENRITCQHLLYTPLEITFSYKPVKAIAFIGTADPWSNIDTVRQLAKENKTPLHIYEGANHSLETSEYIHNIDILKDVMEKSLSIIA